MALTQVSRGLLSTSIVDNGNATAITIDSSENVGVGTGSPSEPLTVLSAQDYQITAAYNATNSTSYGYYGIKNNNTGNPFYFNVGGAERMRIDTSGNLLVGKTSADNSTQGVRIYPTGRQSIVSEADTALIVNRRTSDGTIAEFRKDGTNIGRIQSRSGVVSTIILDPRTNGAGLTGSTNGLVPVDQTGSGTNNVELGSSGSRFNTLYLGNDIAHLDAADNARLLYDKSSNLLGNVGTNGTFATLSKSSGSFRIDHPLPAKTETHHLVHSFVEAPQADNIYRGKVELVDGSATVNIDTAAGMTEGTYVLLNTNTQCFTSNESGWTAIKGSVSGNTLTITAQDNTCTDTISWIVIGERHDQHMFDTSWTDENGKVIVEPLKENN